MLTDAEKERIKQLVWYDDFRTIDDHHTRINEQGETEVEWWIITATHTHVIFRVADPVEFNTKRVEATAYVQQLQEQGRPPFAERQERRIREIVAEMIGKATR